MSLTKVVKKYEQEINGKNRKEALEIFEDELIENIEELSKNTDFFNLSLTNIFSVISKVKFDEIEENDNIMVIIQNIIKNLIKYHSKEKETILILQNINIETIPFTYKEIFSFLELITNCPLLNQFCNSYKEYQQLPDKDIEYEMKQKEKEIEKLKEKIKEEKAHSNFSPISMRPEDFDKDIFHACMKGDISSLRWLIEKQHVNPTIQNTYKDTPIHIAAQYGHLIIVKYLDECKHVDLNIKGWFEKTPLHYACENGYIEIAKYLVSKGAYINVKCGGGYTPLHFAAMTGNLDLISYLISNGANKYARLNNGKTPSDFQIHQ